MEKAITMIAVDRLHPHPDNPRKELGDLSELSESIKAKGILQNLTVVPRDDGDYTVIIGHRRCEAAKLAGLTELPCSIADMTPIEQIQTMLLENMQRADLTVYEQAQSFQQLIELGDTVESLAEKTGFAQTTVRRRLKMAELDREKLKQVSYRQCSLVDYDRLSEIKSIKERNKVLEYIGTNNFEQQLRIALKSQKTKENMPVVKAWIKEHNATMISSSETYGSKYERIGDYMYIHEWKGFSVPKKYEKEKLYCVLDEKWGSISFYVKQNKSKPVKRPQEEIDREHYIAETREQLDAITKTAYELRAAFVDKLKMTKQNERAMLDGAVLAILTASITYKSVSKNCILKKVGIEWDYGHVDECKAKMFREIPENAAISYPTVIYSLFDDDSTYAYYSRYKGEFPKYQKDLTLDNIYRWLTSLGYEMSDDEIALQNGTHPLMTDKDKTNYKEEAR